MTFILAVRVTHELDWQLRAACHGMSRDAFFPNDFELPDPKAKLRCSQCPVKRECLQWALDHDEVGIWGGLTDDERRKISITRSRVRCPDCFSENVQEDEHCEICVNCGLSWPV